MKARFFSSVLPAALGAVLLACGPAWADVIVLLNGRTLQGTLADRDEFASDAHAHEDVVILLAADPGTQPELRRVAIETIDFVVLETNGERRVVDVRGGENLDTEADADFSRPVTSRPAIPRFPYTEGPTHADMARGTSRLGTGATLLVLGAAGTIAGAVIEFETWGPVAWGTGSTSAGDVDYDTRNYIVMAVGGVMMLTGLALIASSGKPPQPALGMEIAGGQPALAYRRQF